MTNRRQFIRRSGAMLLGAAVIGNRAGSILNQVSPRHAVGLQLFTLFPGMDKDPEAALRKVAAIGYREIESAFSTKPGLYGMSPKAFRDLLADLKMRWISHHVIGAPFKMPANAKPMLDASGKPVAFPKMRNLRENMQELVDEVAASGVPWLVCANTPFDTKEELERSIETLNKTGAACKKAGISLAYHNHDREFEKQDGQVIYDQMLAGLDPALVKMELDLCWVTKAGADPVELFKKHPGRFPLWHVKDLSADKKGPVPVGEGIVNFAPVFAHAKEAGMQHFFVEHDMPADPYASITTSYTNLEKILAGGKG